MYPGYSVEWSIIPNDNKAQQGINLVYDHWNQNIEALSTLIALYEGNPMVTIDSQTIGSNAKHWWFLCC